jgi:hypothetical protein
MEVLLFGRWTRIGRAQYATLFAGLPLREVGAAHHADECTCDECRDRFDAVMWGWLDDATAARIQRAYESGDIPASMQ